MKNFRFTFNLLATLILTFACVSLVQAQATRTWVSGTGDDANPCSRTAPCKTFAGAISRTAAGGEINALDPGGFGAVTITKSVTIDGGGTFAGISANSTTGITINALSTDDVIIRNLDINGQGTGVRGINYISAANVTVENCQIYGFTSNIINMSMTNSGSLTVKNSMLEDSAASGIFIKTTSGTAKALITNSHIQRCAVGIDAQDNADVTVRNTVMMGNGGSTIAARLTPSASTPGTMMLEDCVLSHANEGLRVTTGAAGVVEAAISNCIFNNNATGSNAGAGVTVTTFGSNKFFNNGLDTSGSFVLVKPK